MKKKLTLGKHTISQFSRPYVIAEIGVNHEGSLETAKMLIEQAREGGAQAAKFQSYTAGKLASKNSPSYWDLQKEKTTSQYELFKKYDKFTAKHYIELAEHCKKVGIDFLSTPFDDEAIEFLDPLMPFFKVASADITNLPFLKRIARKGKPVVLSTGASTLIEVETAVETLERNGAGELVLLHCILNYPTPNENAHLRMISGLRQSFPDRFIGYSDHTLPDENMKSLVTAYLLGAVVIEKHFTHDRTLPGNDHYHAMDVNDLRRFNLQVDETLVLLGESAFKKPIETESISRQNARRSIVVSAPISKGEIFSEDKLTYKRPGSGISPLHWEEVLGKTAARDLDEDAILQWKDLV